MIFYIFISILGPSGQEDEISTFLHHIPWSFTHTSFKCSWKAFYVGCKKTNITVGLDLTTIKRCIAYLGHMIPLIFSHSGIIMKNEMHHVFHIPNFISKSSYLTTWTSPPGCPKDISNLNVWKWSWSPRHTYLLFPTPQGMATQATSCTGWK